MQQGTLGNPPFDELFTLQQDTDTATPRQRVPIYLIHGGRKPFCSNRACFCQRGKFVGARVYRDIAAGRLRITQFISNLPEDCFFYGHDWQQTEHPDVKECVLCQVRGYCPDCSPVAPAGAQPFSCTYHAERS